MTKKHTRFCAKCKMGTRRQLTNNDRNSFDVRSTSGYSYQWCQCDTVTRAPHQVTMMANVKFHHQHHHRPGLLPVAACP